MFHSGKERDEAVRQIVSKLGDSMRNANNTADQNYVLNNQFNFGETMAYTESLRALGAEVEVKTTPHGDVVRIDSITVNGLEM